MPHSFNWHSTAKIYELGIDQKGCLKEIKSDFRGFLITTSNSIDLAMADFQFFTPFSLVDRLTIQGRRECVGLLSILLFQMSDELKMQSIFKKTTAFKPSLK